MTPHPRKIAAAVLVVSAPVVMVLTRLVYGDRIPDPLPTHWDIRGQVDGTAPLGVFFTASLLVGLVFAVLALWNVFRRAGQQVHRSLAAAAGWTSWLITTVFMAVVLMSLSGSASGLTGLAWVIIAAIPLVPTVVAGLIWLLIPMGLTQDAILESGPADGPGLRLSSTERVVWVGRAHSPLMLMGAGVSALTGVVLVLLMWPAAIVAFGLATILAWMHVLVVRIDDSGLRASWGWFGFPRVVVPLSQIRTARADHIEPLEWGGWGYRITPRGRAMIVRSGPGIIAQKLNSPDLAVTVDDPGSAIEVLNALAERGIPPHSR